MLSWPWGFVMFGVKSSKLKPLGGLFPLCGYGSYPTQPQHCSREGLQLWLVEEVTAPLQPLYFPCLGYLIFSLPWMPDFLWVQGFGYRGLEAERRVQHPGDDFAVPHATKTGGRERAEDLLKGWRQLRRTREVGEIKNNNAKREKEERGKHQYPTALWVAPTCRSHIFQLFSMQCGLEAECLSQFLRGVHTARSFGGAEITPQMSLLPFLCVLLALGFY